MKIFGFLWNIGTLQDHRCKRKFSVDRRMLSVCIYEDRIWSRLAKMAKYVTRIQLINLPRC